jgi:hypothetical protein
VKKISGVFLSVTAFFSVYGQSKFMEDVFRQLPAEKLYNLTPETRDSLLKGKTYYPADNDSSSIVAYNYGISADVADYMYVSMSYETRQRASGMIEIRGFKTKKGENLLVVSNSSGVPLINYQQNELDVFIYRSDKKLVPYKTKLFPEADETIFMKPGIPDSVKQVVINNSSLAFDLSTEKIFLKLNSTYLSGNPLLRKWLKGDVLEYRWTGDRFVISRIGFDGPQKD